MSPNDPRTFFEFLLTLQLFLRGLRGPALDKNGPEHNKTLALMLVKLSKREFKVCKEQYKKSAEYQCSAVLTGHNGEEVKEVTHRQQEL